MILTLRFKFDAAHRLMEHEGKCRNLHGHTWLIEAVVEGAVKKESGMVVDFQDLKLRVKSVINDYDHAVILNRADRVLPPDYGLKRVLMEGEPTCENLAIRLFTELAMVLHTDLGLCSVRVWESKDASALFTDAMLRREDVGP